MLRIGNTASENVRSGMIQTYKVVEDWHSYGQYKGRSVEHEHENSPGAPANDGMGVEVMRISENPYEAQLACSVCIQTSCDPEVEERCAVRCLLPERRERAESRRRNSAANVDIYDDSKDSIVCRGKGLQSPRCFHGVLRPTHLAYHDEEHEVACMDRQLQTEEHHWISYQRRRRPDS